MTPAEDPAVAAQVSRATWRRRGALAGALLALLALGVLTYPLAALRVPEQRARLEDLLRHETGLEVRFSRLTLRWGWLGPEAVLHDVQLGAPGAARPTLRARRLIASLDLWRLTRGGELSAGRITLEDPAIDLAPDAAGPQPAGAGRDSDALSPALRVLAGWRGGGIDIAGGTLRVPLSTQPPLSLGIRHAQLRRLGARWSADAQLLLPAGLGADAQLALRLEGEPAVPEGLNGTLTLSGQQLELAAWRPLAAGLTLSSYLPAAGRADLTLRAQLRGAHLAQIEGHVEAAQLRWRGSAADALTLPQVAADWQLARSGPGWQLSAKAQGLGAEREATLTLTAAGHGSTVHGVVQHVPLPLLAALANLSAPELPLQRLALGGEARRLEFDWDGGRAPGARLSTAAQLEDVAIAIGAARLRGFSAQLSGSPTAFTAQLSGDDAALDFPGGGGERLGQLHLSSLLRFERAAPGWSLSSDALSVTRGELRVTARAALSAPAQRAPLLRASLAIEHADVTLFAGMLTADSLQRLGADLPRPESGRLERLTLRWNGPLAATVSQAGAGFEGAASVHGLSLAAAGDWPRLENIAAELSWHDARGQARIAAADSGSLHLQGGSLAWDLHGVQRLRLAALLSGDAQEGLDWLRGHPQLAGRLSAAGAIDLRGATRTALAVSVARSGAPHVRLATLLDGAQLYAVAGLPPIESLRGTLTVDDGHLQRSQLTGQWLGGAVTLLAGERSGRHGPLPVLSGHGVAAAPEVLAAAHAGTAMTQLAGTTEWRAQLLLSPQNWRLRAESSLAGLASMLPEPFAKAAATPLPLHIELGGADSAALLQVALGERLHAVARLERSGDTWRIERAALRLAAGVPALPAQPQLLLDGRVAHLDLPACLALWRAASIDRALPPLQAQVSAATLTAGSHRYDEVLLSARADAAGSALTLASAGLSGDARWPATISAAQPASVHLQRVALAPPADALLAAGLAAALAPASELSVDELTLDGHALGRLTARLAAQSGTLRVDEFSLQGAAAVSSASGQCRDGGCQLRFRLDSHDGAATLAAFGLRPEASAAHAQLSGELEFAWPAEAPLATLGGHLHMQLEDGSASARPGSAPRFALLAVPALLAGLGPAAGAPGGALHFDRLVADYQLSDGEASTMGLHFDGDAEILVRGRIGLERQDYDQQAWILHGEERLPAPVRRLSPTPRVAAAWLALRELFGAGASDPRGNALRLRGAWNDPIVSPAE